MHGRIFQTIDDFRDAVRDFFLSYNTQRLVEKNGHLSPAAARQRWLDQKPTPWSPISRITSIQVREGATETVEPPDDQGVPLAQHGEGLVEAGPPRGRARDQAQMSPGLHFGPLPFHRAVGRHARERVGRLNVSPVREAAGWADLCDRVTWSVSSKAQKSSGSPLTTRRARPRGPFRDCSKDRFLCRDVTARAFVAMCYIA